MFCYSNLPAGLAVRVPPTLCLALGCFSLVSLLHQSWTVLHHLALTRLPAVTAKAAAFLSSHLIVLLSSFSAAEQKRNCKNPGRSQLNQEGTADGAVPTFCWQWLEPLIPRGGEEKLSRSSLPPSWQGRADARAGRCEREPTGMLPRNSLPPSCLWAGQLTVYRLNPLQAKSQPSGGAEQTLAQWSVGGNVLEEEHGPSKGKSPGVKAGEWF